MAEKGHLTLAAERLHTRQSSVSASVKARKGELSAIIFVFMLIGFLGPTPDSSPASRG